MRREHRRKNSRQHHRADDDQRCPGKPAHTRRTIARRTRAAPRAACLIDPIDRLSVIADPRVDVRVENVYDEIDDEDEDCIHDDHCLQQRVITEDDGLEGEAADSRPGKHRLRKNIPRRRALPNLPRRSGDTDQSDKWVADARPFFHRIH